MRAKWIVAAVFLALAAVFLWVAANSGVRVDVTNVGDTPLEELTVIVKGAEYELGELAAGDSTNVRVKPTGASDVRLRWKSAGKRAVGAVDCYMEPSGYNGTVTVELRGPAVVKAFAEIDVGFF